MLQLEQFDAVAVDVNNAASLGYTPDDAGPTGEAIAVQYRGEFHAWATDLKHAKAIVADAVGGDALADGITATVDYTAGKRWTFEPAE